MEVINNIVMQAYKYDIKYISKMKSNVNMNETDASMSGMNMTDINTQFTGATGHVSGFDAGKDVSVMITLETMLSANAKISAHRFERNENIITRYMQPSLIVSEAGLKTLRHFFLLPRGSVAQARLIDYTTRNEIIKGNNGSPDKTGNTNVVLATHPTHVYITKNDTRFNARKEDTISQKTIDAFNNAGYDLCHIDIKYEIKRLRYYAFVIFLATPEKTCEEASSAPASQDITMTTHTKFLSFYYGLKDDLSTRHIINYLDNLIAGNISASPKKKHHYDFKKKQMVESDESIPFTAISKKVIQRISDIPIPTPTKISPIVPSVVFDEEYSSLSGEGGIYVFYESNVADEYKKVLMDYLSAFTSLIKLDSSSLKLKIENCESKDEMLKDIYLISPTSKQDIAIFSTNITYYSGDVKVKRRKPIISLRHPNIGRVIFGSSPSWSCGGTPGFGSVHRDTCLSALSTSAGSSSIPQSTWSYFVDSMNNYRNGAINEMMGYTTEELNTLIFSDAPLLQSFAGTSCSYVKSLINYIQQTEKQDERMNQQEIDALTSRIREIYMDVLEGHLLLIKNIMNTQVDNYMNTTDTKDENLNDEDINKAKNYIQILQSAKRFTGTIDGHPRSDKTKLIYNAFESRMLGAEKKQFATPSVRKIEGGLFMQLHIRPSNSGDGLVFDKDRSCSTSPYGYEAKAFHRVLRMCPNKLQFFIACKIRMAPDSVILIDQPRNISTSKITIKNVRDVYYLEASMANYLTLGSNCEESKEAYETRKRAFIEYIKNMNSKWLTYIYTREFIERMVPLATENVSNGSDTNTRNNQRIFAIELARFLRLKKNKENSSVENYNIYDLMPYDITTGTLKDADIAFITNTIGKEIPNVLRNFCMKCDYMYKEARNLIILQLFKSPPRTKEEDFTASDYINGFLLSENFEIKSNHNNHPYPTYFSFDQYIAMSASVRYAIDQPDQNMGFMKGIFDVKRFNTGEISSNENTSFPSNPVLAVEMSEVTKKVFANIADVPIYNLTNSQVYVSTLYPTLAAGTSFLYNIVNGLSLRDDKTNVKYEFIRGREQNESKRTFNRDTDEMRDMVKKSGVPLPLSLPSLPASSGASAPPGASHGSQGVWRSDNELRGRNDSDARGKTSTSEAGRDVASIIHGNSIINAFRAFVENGYRTKKERTDHLLSLINTNRRSLRDMQPNANSPEDFWLPNVVELLHKSTMASVKTGRGNEEIKPEDIANEEVEDYLTAQEMRATMAARFKNMRSSTHPTLGASSRPASPTKSRK
jgi:hypothetical protein